MYESHEKRTRSKPKRAPRRLSEPTAAPAQSSVEVDLVTRAQAGEAAASAELVERYRPMAFRLALQLLRNREDAQDLTQDAMLSFLSTLDRFEPSRPVLPWLRRIVRNGAVDRHRRAKVRRSDSLDSDGIEGEAIDLESRSVGPHEHAVRSQLQSTVWRCLGEISESHREILVLRDYQDLAYKEIAEVLDIPLGTVMSRLHAARRKLRDVLLEAGVWSED